jgi:hypothetical protein
MGTPINTPLTSEIWHLTIDDLLEPLADSPRLGGPGPFVINLSASTAPISVPIKAVAEHPGVHVYQIQRTEDRRVRYRLRLGPFETEAEAESLLSTVREIYPSALTATAEPEDLRSIEAIKAKIEAQQLAAVKAAMSKAAAAPLPSVRPGLARILPPEPPTPPELPELSESPERPLAGSSADGEALPTSPPPAWLALTPSPAPAERTNELNPPAPAAKPAPNPPASAKVAPSAPSKSVRGFAPARWSAAARAFVPSADFASSRASAPTPTVEKAPTAAPASGSKPVTSAAAIPPSPAAIAVPCAPTRPDMLARADAPAASAVPESLIPVLSDSMAVPRPTPLSRLAGPALPAHTGSGSAPASPQTSVVGTTSRVATAFPTETTPPVATAWPVMAAPPVVTAPPVLAAPPPSPIVTAIPVVRAAPVATALPVVTAPPVAMPTAVVAAPPFTPAVGLSVLAPTSGPAQVRKVPAGGISSPAAAPRMMPGPLAPAASASRRTPPLDARVESFDTTQTLRPLTPTELEDASALRWFVIQLSCSEEVFDPEALPNLDIFSEYRLYSVASQEQGKTMHALRVGFFSEESHAKAVAGYLGTFYDSPTVKRVSAAERTRFAEHCVEARKDIGATGRHAVIEITDERVIRPKRSANTSMPLMRPPSPTPPSVRGR